MGNEKKSKNLIILAVVIILFVVGVFLTKNQAAKTLTPAEAKAKTEQFIKDNLLSEGTKFTLSDAKEYNAGLYEVDVTLDGSKEPIKSYITKDGKLFVPQGMDIAEVTKQTADSKKAAGATDPAAAAKTAPATEAPKSDKPVVEVFVMSYCPYGTQIEKGIIPVAQALGKTIDFKIKFVDYAMHGDKELKENMFQYCIDQEQHDKMLTYVDCFVKSAAGDQAGCAASTKVDVKKANACVAKVDKQFKIMEVFGKGQSAWGSQFPPFPVYAADNKKYSVGGSPTLIINGKEISASRDAASLAKVICGAFNKAPAECSKAFDATAPAAGFGSAAAPAGAAPAANCATN
ncbi:MAG: hypothetical protein WCO55_06245 [Candidatus Falkowbacteria bacterium]